MRVAVTGSRGLVGQRLVPFLASRGHVVVRVVRGEPSGGDVHWDPERGDIEARGLEGCEGVIHLAGENIGDRRWNASQKERIKESRVRGTRLLAETLTRLDHKPAVLVSASATGFYGERGDYVCDESASSGSGFLTDVCVAWEAATEAALKAGIRVVNVRSGVVLSRAGGALHKMLLPFRLGGGGVVGSGRQIWSWIAIDDLVRIFERALVDESLRGPVNAVAPQAVTNREFTKTLGRVLRRPTLIPMPAWLARLVLGEMADHLLLASTHVVPQRLQDLGFSFTYPDLEAALRHELTDVR